MENNISKFANELTELTGKHIGLDHIYPTKDGRYYYTQAPKAGAPMLLHHYRGVVFVDIHPDDYESIASGKVSAHDYIASANWQVGYYWGGGLMIGGGYYQPIDIIGRKNEVQRYLRLISCRGNQRSSGYMPTENDCNNCPVNNCPFSKFKQGSWEDEMPEHDPRCDLFKALCTRFERETGYTLRGFICGEIPDGEIWIRPNGRYSEEEPLSFLASASDTVIQSLLMHEIEPENWDEYAKSFQFRIHKMFDSHTYEVTPETLEKAYEGLDYTKKETEPEDDITEEVPLMTRVMAFFKKMF